MSDSSAGDAMFRILLKSVWWCIKQIFTFLPRLIRWIVNKVKESQAAKKNAQQQGK